MSAVRHLELEHSFADSLEGLYAACTPAGFPAPKLQLLNRPLAEQLGLDAEWLQAHGAAVLSGSELPSTVRPIAQACQAQRDAVLSTGGEGWSHICPPASLEPGRRTGRYRLGTDTLVMGEDGRSAISVEDFAIAIVDEAESRAHAGRSFTVGW